MFKYLNKYNKKGIFLMEVLVSAVLVAAVVVSILYSLQRVLRVFSVSNNYTKSIYLAEKKLFEERYEPGSVTNKGEFSKPNQDFMWILIRKPLTKTGDLYRATVTVKNKINKRVYAELSLWVKK